MAFITAYCLCNILITLATLTAVVYAYFRYTYQYWRRRGIPTPIEPSIPFGNVRGMATTIATDILLGDWYKAAPNDNLIGVFIYNMPILLVRDLELVKNIMIKEHGSFYNRGFTVNEENDPLAGHLFFKSGPEWRNLRIKMTPTFTSGKMKMMFSTLIGVGEQLGSVLEEATQNEETEIKDIVARYTTDVISSVAFGIDSSSLKNPDAEFRKMGQKMTAPSKTERLQQMFVFMFPKLGPMLGAKIVPQYQSDFFINLVRETIEYRKKNDVKRNDFMQLLLQLTTIGYVEDADSTHKEHKGEEHLQKFTTEQAAAQAFLFFFAGFETSSTTMQFALYELALNPELQKLAQEEVDEVKKKNDGKITYEGVMGMDLLDRIVAETLRKYPVAGIVLRQCNKEYNVPGTNQKIESGQQLWFPVYGYHHDPKYYPDPEKFDPDRFLPEIKATRPQCAYIPFGEGPRSCIGNRFGLMQTKTGLSIILSSFTVSPSKSTPIPVEFDPKANFLSPKGGMHLKVSKRK